MGATRVVMTMGMIVAIGAGAFLALSTIPALAPYQERGHDRRTPLVALPEPETRSEIPAAPAYGLAIPSEQESSDDDFRLGSHDGRLVIELPRWIEDGGAWLTLGRHAWRDWVEPGDQSDDEDEQRYAPRRHGDRDDGAYGTRQDYAQRRERQWRDDENETYGGDDHWSERIEPPLPPTAPYASDRQARRESDAAQSQAPADAAASAAARAHEAARDVRAAEGAVQ